MADEKKEKGKDDKKQEEESTEVKPAKKEKPKPQRKGEKVKSQKWKMYEISGDKIKRKKKFCPKCGEGVFLAQHKTRESCGKCGYTEFRKTT